MRRPLLDVVPVLAFGLLVVAGCTRHVPPAAPAALPDVALPPPPPRVIPAGNPAIVRELTTRGLEAREVAEGVVIYLPQVQLFAFDRAEIDPAARGALRDLAATLNGPSLADRRIVVEGHADAIGGRDYNLALSERRAAAVLAVLIEHGVAKARLRTRAFGLAQPIAPNRLDDGRDNPDGRARNRRVALLLENPVR